MKYIKGDFDQVPNRKARVGMPANMQAVFMWICSHANAEGLCFPSMATLARETDLSESTVKSHVKGLVERGFLSVSDRYRGGRQTSNLYQIHVIEKTENKDPDEVDSEISVISRDGFRGSMVSPLKNHPPGGSMVDPLGGQWLPTNDNQSDDNQMDNTKSDHVLSIESNGSGTDGEVPVVKGRHGFPKIFDFDTLNALRGTHARWDKDPESVNRMLWLVEQTGLSVLQLEDAMFWFTQFVLNTPTYKPGVSKNDLLTWFAEWGLAARKERRIEFNKTQEGRWLANGEYSQPDGTVTIVTGGFNPRTHDEITYTKATWKKREDEYYKKLRENHIPEPEGKNVNEI